ncbi:hypothetical protein [Prosthecomicrobium sp. N25]|uniref:hypothetical protein n=1 Tax=Prosthecomicrobium sp. N25 TaxID=3129254 RepID=UPI00307841B9
MIPDPTGADARTVTAFFDDKAAAERAVERLQAAGFRPDDLRFVAGTQKQAAEAGFARAEDKGLWETLTDYLIPDGDRLIYEEALKRGGYLVTASANSGSYERALDILDEEGTVDLDQREAEWRASGWTPVDIERPAEPGGLDRSREPNVLDRGYDPAAERRGMRDTSHGRTRARGYVWHTGP